MVAAASKSVLLLTHRTDVADAFRPPGGITWTLQVEDPRAADLEALAPRFLLAIIDFGSAPRGIRVGRVLRRENPEIEYVAVVEQESDGVAAIRAGALDYVLWPPVDPEHVRRVLLSHAARAGAEERPMIGRFRLLRRLGSGGMAEVFLAESADEPGRHFAVKRALPAISRDRESITMFMDEARISAALHHPNIVEVVDFGNVSGTLFLAMEYVAGPNLANVGRKRGWKLDPRLAAHVCAEIAQALAYAHARTDDGGRPLAIIHRDVNPPNILLAEDGRVLLSDFGIAKARQRQTHTTAGAVKGKLDYLSPEQVMGMEIDRRADLFSLGAVLYLLLTGVQPFRASGPALTLMRIRDAQVAPPSVLDRRLPPAFDAIVARALARDRNARYADGAAFERDLRAVLQTLGPVTRREMQAFVAEEWPARASGAVDGKLEVAAGEEEDLADLRDDDEVGGGRRADELSALVPADSIGLGEAHAPSAGISLPSSDGSDPIVGGDGSGAGSVSGSISISIATDRTAISRRPEATIVSPHEPAVVPNESAAAEHTALAERTAAGEPTVAPEEPPALEDTAPRARSAPPAEDTSPAAWRIPEKRRSAAPPVPQEGADLAQTKSSSMPRPDAVPERAPVLREGATRTAPPRGARDAAEFPWAAPPPARRTPIIALVMLLGVAALGAWRLHSRPARPPTPTPILAEATNEVPATPSSSPAAARAPKLAHTAPPRAVAPATNGAAATPRPIPTATRVAVAAPRTGTLSIWIDGGWATVTVDGKPAATAPIVGLELPEGPHKIVLENPGTGFLHEYDLRITAGRESKLTAQLGAPDPPPTSPAAP